ncbi:MAG: pitrilysin family protein, partial [Xanthomonadales bacterium]|nr:pitrilysin family protein [Xanthomonadales bacterium]
MRGLILIIGMFLGTFAAAQELPDGVTRGASIEGITEYQLDNGLRVILFPDQSKEQITVNITYFVGSRHEGYGETGMAHLLEHLLFKGSENHPDIPQELTERGTRPNGTTWFDRTNYFETFPASEDNLEWAIDLEADRMINTFVTREALEPEMTVVRNEWEAGENSPLSVLMKRVLSAAFDWHNYGNATIGARADIENVPIERLQAFYRKYYQPDNAMLVIAGRFEPEFALEAVAEKFGSIPRPERTGLMKLFDTYTREQPQDGMREVILRRVGDTQIVMAAYHVAPAAHPDSAAMDIVERVLRREPSGRLYERMVEPGIASNATAFTWLLREPSVLFAYAELQKDDDLGVAREALLETVESLRDTPPTEEEMERARTELLNQMDRAIRDTQAFALQMSEWAAAGDWRLYFIHRDRLKEVTAEEVSAAADRYLLRSNLTVGGFLPVEETPPRAEIPDAPDIEALVENYESDEEISEGEVFDPSPRNIADRTSFRRLDSGLRVAFLPKENRGDVVVIDFAMRYGTLEALRGQGRVANVVPSMMMRGTENMTREEIRDRMDQLNTRISIGGNAGVVGGGLETERQYLPEALELLDEILRRPRFDPEEFEILRKERITALEAARTEPNVQAGIAMQRHSNPHEPDHPDYTPTIEERIEFWQGLNVATLKDHYEQFYGVNPRSNFVVVGDFDPEVVMPLIEKTFGDWETKTPYERYPRPYQDVEPLRKRIETPDKANAIMLVNQNLAIRDDDPDYAAMVLGNYMLGGGFLNSRLATRIRREEGLSYGVGSSFSAHGIDTRGSFGGYAIFAPENVSKVEAAFLEEVGNVLESGYSADEVERAKRGLLDGWRVDRTRDGALANLLENNMFYDRGMEYTQRLIDRIE